MQREDMLVPFVEPVLRFCLSRVSHRADAEDLAGEIMLHALVGLRKYEVTNVEAWVWRIAHNRYARFLEKKRTSPIFCSEEYALNVIGDTDPEILDEESRRFDLVFEMLHTLSREYKNILVDHYIGGLSVRALAEKYALSESTVKWRLHVSYEKIRERIEKKMKDKIYTRLNWNTNTCNGAFNANEYLHGQVARAICEAAYEKPLSVEEISLQTGLPTMYIEDALPNLLYGDAITQVGAKYATDFIILRKKDREAMAKEFAPLVKTIADHFEALFEKTARVLPDMDFWGHDRGMKKLGYIALPMALRGRIWRIKKELGLESGAYPPRHDGGNGWYIVEETADESDCPDDYVTGCNVTDEEDGCLYYYLIMRYFREDIYHRGGMRWLSAEKIVQQCQNGIIPDGLLGEEDLARLLRINLVKKENGVYALNFPCFTGEAWDAFAALFHSECAKLDELIKALILSVKKHFVSFTPKRLEGQINQWVSVFTQRIGAYVTEELIVRDVLEKPTDDIPMTNGVFFVEGKYRFI